MRTSSLTNRICKPGSQRRGFEKVNAFSINGGIDQNNSGSVEFELATNGQWV
ncbi:MAG: hypothetical protein AB8B55_05205 [Mariniblastus sp.]